MFALEKIPINRGEPDSQSGLSWGHLQEKQWWRLKNVTIVYLLSLCPS